MKRRVVIAAALVAAVAAGGALYRVYPVQVSLLVATTRNVLRSWSAPKGATTTEVNPAYKGAAAAAPLRAAATANAADEDWPSYDRTLTSERLPSDCARRIRAAPFRGGAA